MREAALGLLECSAMASVVILAVVVLRVAFARRISPAAMLALWALALARLMLPVALPSPVHMDALWPKPAAVATNVSAQAPTGPHPSSPAAGNDTHPAAPAILLPQTMGMPTEPPVAPQKPWVERLDPWAWGVTLWALGAAWMLVLAAVQARRLRKLMILCPPVTDAALLAQVDAVRVELGIHARVSVLRCDWAAAPMVYGILRPALLLPPAYMAADSTALRGVLLHELGHIRHRDLLKGVLWLVARAAHWFNPLVHVAHRLYCADVELARDALATSRLAPNARLLYGETLLAAARAQRTRTPHPVAVALLGGSGIGTRVRAILAPLRPSRTLATLCVALSVMLVFGCFTTACQPTPNKPAVVQKNIDSMEQQAIGTTGVKNTQATTASAAAASGGGARALKARLQVPDHFTATVDDPSGKLTITADADFVLPDVEKLPTTRIQPRLFTQKTVDKLIGVLMQGQPLYTDTVQQQTKKDIWPRLQALYDMRDGKRKVDVDGTLEENIKAVEQHYKEAPDDVAYAPANTKLHKADDQDYEFMEGYARINDIPAYLAVFNWPDMGKVEAQFINRTSAWGAHGFKPWHTITDQELQQVDSNYSRLTIKPEDARSIADDIVSKLGLSDILNAVTLNWAINDSDHILAYDVQYRRAINGVPVTITGQRGELYRESADNSYTHAWPYEVFDIYVTDQGLTELQWTSPYTTPQLVTDNTQLLPFSDIQQRFNDAILAKYAIYEKGMTGQIHIDSVQLGLMRIKDPRTSDEALLVPVWDFFGVASYHPSDRGDYAYPQDSRLTINAIDGTVIDRDLGY